MNISAETSLPPSAAQGEFSLGDLDADNKQTVEETKARIQGNLHSSRDTGLLNAMVEYYLKTRSPACLQILSSIHEARAQALFEKMNECLRHPPTRFDTLTLLGHIVRKQPSWLYKIIKTSLFESLLKCMKGDRDVLVLTSGIFTITTLLPLVPASIGHCLQDLFDIFIRLSSFRSRRPGNSPEVHLLHLHVAVYMFFHRLYAMYPNNFMAYLKSQYNEPSKQSLFQNTIQPMIQHVRLHPCFLTETLHSETEKHRWRQKEPHDIVIECMKLSLDPIDRMQEKGNFMSSWTSKQSSQELFAEKSISSIFTASSDSQGPESTNRLKERRMSDSATQTGKSLQSGDSGTDSCSLPIISTDEITAGWSPSDTCRLNTPPSSQMSPSTSNPDLVSSINIQSHCSTPAAIYTPGDSPTTSLGGDVAYHHAYSSSPSVSGSRGKSAMSSWTHSGRGTPVRGGKAASHEGQLTRALYSALAHHSTESAPAAIGGHQTSTPKESVKCEKGEEEDGVLYDEPHSLAFPSSGMFEVQGEETNENLTSSTTEQFDSGNFNVSPKEEFRDFSGQSEDFVSEISERKSIESHEGVIGSDFVPGSLTPVGSRSLDAVTLSATPSDSVNISADAYTSTEPEELNVMQPGYDSDSSLPNKELDEQPASITFDKEHQLQDAHKSETSLASLEASSDFSKFHSTTSAVHQNHPSSHTCELIAAFPQLLPLFQSDQEHSQSGYSSLADGDDAALLRSQQHLCGASPVEILDNYLKTGNSIHYGELSRIPIVSQTGTVWTHFGGEPPVDEVEILRGQVKLLHNQLLFERHKCDLHAIRNRRLIGKTFKAVQYQEELQATKDQLRLQEDKMRELTDALNKQVEENRRFKELTSTWDHQQRLQLRNLTNENNQLKTTQNEFQEKLEAQQKEFDTKQTEINQVRATVFTLENELERLKVEVSEKDQLTEQVNHLVKEHLIMGELNQQQKDTIQKLTLAEGQSPESSMQLHGCHRELSAAKQTLKKQKTELEATTSKLTDMETLVSSKDVEIRELKKFTESLKGTYIGKIKSLEEKYNAQKKITQTLESYILDLQSAVDSEKQNIEHNA